jgi:hypothetical protein
MSDQPAKICPRCGGEQTHALQTLDQVKKGHVWIEKKGTLARCDKCQFIF